MHTPPARRPLSVLALPVATLVPLLAGVVAAPPAASAPDTAPPEVLSIDYTPQTVNTFEGTRTVRVTARLRDPSGVEAPLVVLDSRTTTQQVLARLVRTSGTATDGTWAVDAAVRSTNATGAWSVRVISIKDMIGNIAPSWSGPDLWVTQWPDDAADPPLTVSAVRGDGQAVVSWSAAGERAGDPVTGYEVSSSPAGGTCTTDGARSCTVTGLTNGTSYTFAVVALTATGRSPQSPPSAAVTPAGVPVPPSVFSGRRSDGQAWLSWPPAGDNGSPVVEYRITASPSATTCIMGGGARQCVVKNLTNGVPYTFTLTARNALGWSAPLTTTVVPGRVPGAPTGLRAEPRDGGATVSWSPPLDDGGYAVTEYRVVDGAGAQVCVTAALSCDVAGLVNGTASRFDVRAVNEVGSGPLTGAPVAVTPRGAPSAPATVAATAVADGVRVSWDAAAPNGAPVDGYEVVASGTGTGCSTTTALSCVVTGLESGRTHTFTVRARNVAGWSVASEPTGSVAWTYVPRAEVGLDVVVEQAPTWRDGSGGARVVVRLTNNGPDALDEAVLPLDLPAGVVAQWRGGLLECGDGACRLAHGPLPAGQAATATLDLVLPSAGRHDVQVSAGRLVPAAPDGAGAADAVATLDLPADEHAPTLRLGRVPRFSITDVVRVPVRASDAVSGLARLEVSLRRTTFGGAWTAWEVESWDPGMSEIAVVPRDAQDQCVRVRALDHAGQWSRPVTRCTARFADEADLAAGSGWSDVWSTSLWRNAAVTTTRRGAVLRGPAVTGRQVAVLATTCRNCGSLAVLVGGRVVDRLDLGGRRTRPRQVLTTRTFPARSGRLVLRSLGGGRTTVDGFAVGR